MKFDALTADALLAAAGDAPLKSAALDSAGTTTALNREFSARAGGVQITAATNARATIALFRHPGAADPDGLVPDPLVTSDGDDALPPPIALDLGRVALKYRLGCSVNAAAGEAGAEWGVQAGADGDVAFGYYSNHDETVPLSDALRTDFEAFKHPFSVDEILGLKPGTAVFWKTNGRLSLQLSYNAADLLAGNFLLLQKALQGAGLMQGTFNGGITINVAAMAADAFLVCFSRDIHPGILVSLHKARAATAGARIAASVKVDYASSDAVAKLLAEACDKLLQLPDPQIINEIKSRTSYHQLTPTEKAHVDRVLARLPVQDTASDRLAKFKQLLANLQRAISDELKGRLTAAWGYDYERVDASETVLVARVADDKLGRFHGDLLRLRADTLMTAASQPDAAAQGILLQRLLHKRVTEITHTWGFTLGFSRFRFGGREVARRRRIKRRTAAGERLLLEATRRREQMISWEVQGFALCGLDATMRDYVPHPAPSDFDYTLRIGWELGSFANKPDRLARALDEAAVLGTISDLPRLERANELAAALHLAEWSDVKLVTGIELDAPATAALLEVVAGGSALLKGKAFAAALPWLAAFNGQEIPGRHTTEKRVAIYGPIFTDLSENRLALVDIPNRVRQAESWNRYGSLANSEASSGDNEPWYVRGLLGLHGHYSAAHPRPFDAPWDRAMKWLASLATATRVANAPVQTIDEAMNALDGIWASRLFVRAFGWLINQLAHTNGVLRSGTTRTAILKGKINGVPVSYPLS